MSSQADLQSALTSIQQNDYVTLAILSVVAYDYALTFTKEIEYIWGKPWTWVSTLFIFVRYCGIYSIATSILIGSSFLPGPVRYSCEIINVIYNWVFVFFFAAADFVMILRVWAMYNRSKPILIMLLILFALEISFTILVIALASNPKNMLTTTVQILNFSFCSVQGISPTWTQVATVLQMVHGAAVCLLAIIQFMRQAFQMYRATKQWQPNRYMNLFVKEGILYFFAIFLFNLINVLGTSGNLPSAGWQIVLLSIVEYVPMYTLSPRFVLSMRELYARDAHGRREGGIDTAFGLSGCDAAGTALVFANVGEDEGAGNVEGMPMETTVAATTEVN